MSEILLPCPFCGGPAGEVGLEFVTCLSAEVGTEQTCPGKQIRVDVEDAESWNTRSGGAPCTLEPVSADKLFEWIKGNVPLYFDYGGKAVSFSWSPETLTEDLLAFLTRLPRSAASSATDLLAWLRDETSLELSFERWEEDGRWQVHEIRGGRNDQEWSLLGSGDTPEQALSAAKIALEVRKDAKAATRARNDRGSPNNG